MAGPRHNDRPPRWTVALCCVAAVLAAPASGGADDSPAGLLTAAPTTQPAQPVAAEGAAAVRLVALLPLSGELAPYGRSARRGAELAVAQANRQGGIAGRPVELLVLDTRSRSAQADTLASRAILLERADALLGGLHGPSALAIRPVAEKQRTPFLVLNGGYRFPADGAVFTRRVVVSDADLADAMTRFARLLLQAERVFVVSDVTTDQANLTADRFAERFVRDGGRLAGFEAVQLQRNRTGLAAAMEGLADRIAKERPDAVFTSLGGERLIALADPLRKLLPDAVLLATGPVWSLAPLLSPSAGSVRPAYLATEFCPDDPDPRVRQFAAELARSDPQADPDAVSAAAFDAVRLLVDAARRRQNEGGTLQERMLDTRALPGISGPVGFDQAGRIVRPVTICRLERAGPGQPDGSDPGNRLTFLQRMWPAEPPADPNAAAADGGAGPRADLLPGQETKP